MFLVFIRFNYYKLVYFLNLYFNYTYTVYLYVKKNLSVQSYFKPFPLTVANKMKKLRGIIKYLNTN